MGVGTVAVAESGSGASNALELRRVSKTFAGVRVLESVDLTVRPGEVHGLIGQNGSGKSTLIKILAGYHDPDSGARLTIGGRPVALPIAAGEAHRHGLSFLHQDLALIDSMSVLENIAIGRGYRTSGAWRIRWKEERTEARRQLAKFGLDIDPDIPIRRLTQAQRAIVGIIRALEQLESGESARASILVFDEPTTQLPGPDVARLFAAIHTATKLGASAIFVSHRLEEVLALTDRVSVLRDGRLVGTIATAEADERELMRMVLGRELQELYPSLGSPPGKTVALSVRGLCGERARDVSFDVHEGEILGATGLVGMGHEEVPYLVFGALRRSAGTVTLRGEQIDDGSPRSALDAGIALLPADRQHHGSMQTAKVLENVTLPWIGRFYVGGRLRHRREFSEVADLLRQLDVRPPEPNRCFSSLSGGNQQKALFGKWLKSEPHVLLLHEPTQGVDVGARRQIYDLIRQTIERGTGVFLCSSEHEDLAHLCDRVLVFRNGCIVAELSGEALTAEHVAELMYMSAEDV